VRRVERIGQVLAVAERLSGSAAAEAVARPPVLRLPNSNDIASKRRAVCTAGAGARAAQNRAVERRCKRRKGAAENGRRKRAAGAGVPDAEKEEDGEANLQE
jgi:hypothetical protein